MALFSFSRGNPIDNLVQQVHAVLSTTPARWRSLAETLPAELLMRPPAPGEWSALECLQHLLDAEQFVFPVRVEALLAGRDFEAFNPDAQGSSPRLGPAEMAAEFARHRAANLDALLRVRPADLSRTARHSELGMVTLSELLHEWAAHDLMHTVQAERAMMQPFIVGCGPWQLYFKGHDLTATK